MGSITVAIAQYDEEHALARRLTLPEEDRVRYVPAAKWEGGYCLEKARHFGQWAGFERLP
jgi:hypothetical protein